MRAGMPENLERKVIYLEEVIRKLNVTDTGSIELSGEQLRFVPSDSTPELNPAGRDIEIEPADTGRDPHQADESETVTEPNPDEENGSESGGDETESGSEDTGEESKESTEPSPEEEKESGGEESSGD